MKLVQRGVTSQSAEIKRKRGKDAVSNSCPVEFKGGVNETLAVFGDKPETRRGGGTSHGP